VSRRAALIVALGLLVFRASLSADEAGGDKRLPVIGTAPPFALTSQDSKPVALADFRGRAVALSFIYTGCPDICPMLMQKMVDVQDTLGTDFGTKVAFVSITLDPERDTPEEGGRRGRSFAAHLARRCRRRAARPVPRRAFRSRGVPA
jgi:protein SCO1/2